MMIVKCLRVRSEKGRKRKGRGGEREEREWRANSAQTMNKRKLNLKELGWERSGGIDV